MCISNIGSAIKKMRVNELRDFSYENYFKWVGFNKETVVIH